MLFFLHPTLLTTVKFMLLTNIAVAQQIAVALPEQALLRRHDTPVERRLVCVICLVFGAMPYVLLLECLCRACSTLGSQHGYILIRRLNEVF